MDSQLLEKGIEAFKKGDKQLAGELFKKFTQLDPENERAWMWLAACTDRVKEKRDYLQKALFLNPNNKSARKALSQYVLRPQLPHRSLIAPGLATSESETVRHGIGKPLNESLTRNTDSSMQSNRGLLEIGKQDKKKSSFFQFQFTYANIGFIYLIGFILLFLLVFQLNNSAKIPAAPRSFSLPDQTENQIRTPFQPDAPTLSSVNSPSIALINPTSAAPPSAISPVIPNSPTTPFLATQTFASTNPPASATTNPATAVTTKPPSSAATNQPITAPTKPPTTAPTQPPTAAPTIPPAIAPTNTPTVTTNVVLDTYYVSPDGNDANPGSQAQPWKTIGKAASTVMAGNTVNIGAGTYNENVVISKSGSDSAPITFQGGASPHIVSSSPSTTACLDAANSCILGTVTISGSQIVMKNLEVAGPPANPGAMAGITVKGSNDEISNNFIHNSWREGIAIRSSTRSDHVLNNHIMYSVVSGIYFDGQNHLIQGNTITHSVTRPADGSALSGGTDPDGIRFFGSGSVVRKNTIKDIYLDESPQGDNPHQDCFQTWGTAVNISFEQNHCELENSTNNSDPMVKFFMIERQSGTNIDNIKIINNIFVSRSTATLWTPINLGNDSCSTSNPLQNITIENNTFVHPGNVVADFAILMRCTNTATIRNNAFYNFGNSSYPYIYQDRNNNSNVTISNNSVFNSDGSSPKDGAYPGDTALWMINPMFEDVDGGDYRLQPGSPLINAGIDLGGFVSNDYAGTSRPQGAGYDIGAFESP